LQTVILVYSNYILVSGQKIWVDTDKLAIIANIAIMLLYKHGPKDRTKEISLKTSYKAKDKHKKRKVKLVNLLVVFFWLKSSNLLSSFMSLSFTVFSLTYIIEYLSTTSDVCIKY
jgi:hypothetical protein